jgi:hypothetical protein
MDWGFGFGSLVAPYGARAVYVLGLEHVPHNVQRVEHGVGGQALCASRVICGRVTRHLCARVENCVRSALLKNAGACQNVLRETCEIKPGMCSAPRRCWRW